MLVKILDADDDLVDRLKFVTGCATASKAFVFAATAYLGQLETGARQRDKIARLEARLAIAEQTIQRARSAAALLLEKTSQGDLLDDC